MRSITHERTYSKIPAGTLVHYYEFTFHTKCDVLISISSITKNPWEIIELWKTYLSDIESLIRMICSIRTRANEKMLWTLALSRSVIYTNFIFDSLYVWYVLFLDIIEKYLISKVDRCKRNLLLWNRKIKNLFNLITKVYRLNPLCCF